MKTLQLIGLALIAISCTKTQTVDRDLNFYLTERGKGNTVGNMQLEVNGPNITRTVVTNTVGKASLHVESGGTYTVRPIVDNVNFMYNLEDKVTFDPATNYSVNVKVTPYGFIRIKVKNGIPCDAADKLTVYGEWNSGTAPSYTGDCSVNQFVEKNGKTIFPVQGADYCKISWTVTNGTVTKTFLDSIKVPAHDTITYNLNY